MTQKKPEELEGAGAAALAALEKELDQAEQAALSDLSASTKREDATPEEAQNRLSKAQIAQILDRGIVNDRLNIAVPKDRVGYWVRERQEDIDRMLALGGRMEQSSKLGVKGLHGAGDDRIRIGDVILMSLPRQIVEVIAEINEENKRKLLTKGKGEFLKNRVPGVPHYEEV